MSQLLKSNAIITQTSSLLFTALTAGGADSCLHALGSTGVLTFRRATFLCSVFLLTSVNKFVRLASCTSCPTSLVLAQHGEEHAVHCGKLRAAHSGPHFAGAQNLEATACVGEQVLLPCLMVFLLLPREHWNLLDYHWRCFKIVQVRHCCKKIKH